MFKNECLCLCRKETAITLNLDFGFLSISPWTTIKRVCTAPYSVHGLTVKFHSGFRVSYSSKLESPLPDDSVAVWSVRFHCLTSLCSGPRGARRGQWGSVRWESPHFRCCFSHVLRSSPRGPTEGQWSWPEAWAWVWEVGLHLIKMIKSWPDNQALERRSPLCLFYVFPGNRSRRRSFVLWRGENGAQKDQALALDPSSRVVPQIFKSVSSARGPPQGLSPGKGCFLEKDPPQLLALKMLAACNNLYTCATFCDWWLGTMKQKSVKLNIDASQRTCIF